jgi:hypothetical protein
MEPPTIPRRLTAAGSTSGQNLLQTSLASPNSLPMNVAKKSLLVALLAVALAALFAGCVGPKTDSSIPWNRPADWEGRIPGMGQ